MAQLPREDAVGRAVGWLLLGVSGGLCLDLCAKQLLGTYPLVQFVFLRSLAGLLLFLLLGPLLGGWRQLATGRWRWHLLRTLLASGSMFGFFFGLSRLPLVETLTLGFTAPLMLTALSRPLLGEHVGWRRWLAVIAGFAGVVVVLRPSHGFEALPALAVLCSALCYACLAMTARHLGRTESSYALSVWVVAGPLALSGVLLGRDAAWVAPDAGAAFLFVLAGACSVVAWLGIINGYRGAAPAILAPLEYTSLVGGALAGYLFWGEVPDAFVVAGAAIIIASGLYVVYRELGGDFARYGRRLFRPRRS
ncbi:MAG TPA: DMT family transporter [Woeseiaceae bacterium]|nr:DMT family transporter [Woeseiaceae bacterium]